MNLYFTIIKVTGRLAVWYNLLSPSTTFRWDILLFQQKSLFAKQCNKSSRKETEF